MILTISRDHAVFVQNKKEESGLFSVVRFLSWATMCAVFCIFISKTLCIMCNDLDVIKVEGSIFNNTSIVFILSVSSSCSWTEAVSFG